MARRTKKLAEWPLRVTPFDWLKKAQALKQASNHLLIRFEEDQLAYDEEFERNHHFDLQSQDRSVLVMLLGFAIENLLKGLYVSTLPIVRPPRTLRELDMPGHRLAVITNKIAHALGEQFSKREFDILAVVEESIVWRGRYPSPVDVDNLISPSADILFSSFRYPVDHFALCTLYDRLESLLIPRAPFSIQRKTVHNVHVGRMPGESEDSEQPEG